LLTEAFCRSNSVINAGTLKNNVQPKGEAVDLTPGEKAVLGQIRVLYSTAAARNHQIKSLMMQWPPTDHEAYQKSYVGLLAKQLIEPAGAQVFKITDAGLNAIGVEYKDRKYRWPARVNGGRFHRLGRTIVGQRQGKAHRSGVGNTLSRFLTGLLGPSTPRTWR
jgi:hypothetical protein